MTLNISLVAHQCATTPSKVFGLPTFIIIDKMTSTEHENVTMTNLKYLKTMTVLRMITLLISLTWGHAAASSERHAAIEAGVERYLLNALQSDQQDTNINISVVDIDDRIVIPDCIEGFDYHADNEALAHSYISVRVSCRNNDWYLFSSAQVSRTRQIVVTAGMISPGTVLTSENLKVADIDVKRLRHTAYSDLTQLIGARMKRRVREGSPVQANMLCFVCKGDRITITARTAGMQVKTAGIAQQDGVVGDTIKVVNASSNKSVIAEVASAQTVVVNL